MKAHLLLAAAALGLSACHGTPAGSTAGPGNAIDNAVALNESDAASSGAGTTTPPAEPVSSAPAPDAPAPDAPDDAAGSSGTNTAIN